MHILHGNNTIEFSSIPALLRLVLKALQQFEGIFRIKIQCEEYSQQMAFNSTIAQNNTETTKQHANKHNHSTVSKLIRCGRNVS